MCDATLSKKPIFLKSSDHSTKTICRKRTLKQIFGITGLFCKVKDSADLAKKMEVMIKMPENERQKMGQMGRQKMLDQYDELIVLKHYTQTIADLFNIRNP